MRKVWLLLLTVLIISTIFITRKHSEAEELTADSQTVLKLSQPYLQENYSFEARWIYDGAGYGSLADFQAYYKTLSLKLSLQPSESVDYVNGLPVLRGSSPLAEGAQLQSMLVGSKDQKSSMWIIRINAAPPMKMDQVVQAQQILNDKLAGMGLKGSWNFVVQGTLNDLGRGKSPEAFINQLNDQIQGNEQEIYRDDQTVSVSMFSKRIHTSVQSGSHKVNLQMALHQNSVTKSWRFTIGSPLITIEY